MWFFYRHANPLCKAPCLIDVRIGQTDERLFSTELAFSDVIGADDTFKPGRDFLQDFISGQMAELADVSFDIFPDLKTKVYSPIDIFFELVFRSTTCFFLEFLQFVHGFQGCHGIQVQVLQFLKQQPRLTREKA
jgi:hypothetical protein